MLWLQQIASLMEIMGLNMFNLNDVKEWYWAGHPIPKTLKPLDSDSQKIVYNTKNIVGLKADDIIFTHEKTAYTDLEKVFIPTMYMNWDNIESVAKESVFVDGFTDLSDSEKFLVILSIYNTFFVHEFTHMTKTKSMPRNKTQLFCSIFNFVEDIYINDIASKTDYLVFYKILYSLFYNQNIYQYTQLKDSDIDKMDSDKYTEYFMNMFLLGVFDNVLYGDFQTFPIHYDKNGNKPAYNRAIQAMKAIKGTDTFEGRGKRTDAIYDYLLTIQDDKTPQQNQKSTSPLSELIQELVDALEQTEMVAVNDLRDFQDDDKRTEMFGKGGEVKYNDVIISSVMNLMGNGRQIKPDSKMRELIKNFRYQWGVRKQQVHNYSNGQKLHDKKLFNAPIDGKIFKKGREQERVLNKPQVMFLIDSSGSMDSILNHVLSCSYGMAMGLYEMGYHFSFWAHTTTNGGKPILYNIMSYGLPNEKGDVVYNTEISDRFAKATRINTMGNQDYDIINKITDYFNPSSKRNLFVLSDGSPNPSPIGVDRTKVIVGEKRKEGINVYSMSLVQDVVEDNNKIYGSQYNFRAYGSLLTESFKKIGEMLGKEKI